MCISVDLPEPDGPMIAVNEPRSKSTDTPRSASTAASPSPKRLVISWPRTTGSRPATAEGGAARCDAVQFPCTQAAVITQRDHPMRPAKRSRRTAHLWPRRGRPGDLDDQAAKADHGRDAEAPDKRPGRDENEVREEDSERHDHDAQRGQRVEAGERRREERTPREKTKTSRSEQRAGRPGAGGGTTVAVVRSARASGSCARAPRARARRRAAQVEPPPTRR